MTDKLKPCPFCGGENVGVFKRRTFNIFKYSAHCYDCHFGLNLSNTEEEAITSWNTRKPMDRIVEQLENAKEKCSQAHNAAIFTYTRFEYKGATSGLAHAIAIVKGVQNENAE